MNCLAGPADGGQSVVVNPGAAVGGAAPPLPVCAWATPKTFSGDRQSKVQILL